MASLNVVPTPPEAPPEAVKPRFGRKLYLVIGLVAIAIIATASIIVFTQFMPGGGSRGTAKPGDGEGNGTMTVPLELSYSVGEKMTYEINITMEAMDEEVSQVGTLEMEVLIFDGENYTIRQTMTLDQQEISFTVKMNQTGHIIEYTGLPPEFEQTFSSFVGVPGFGSYFPKEEVRVGESWEIPIDIEMAMMDLEGTISYELSEITSVTVPAGTYEALKIKIKPSDLHATYSIEETGFHLNLKINGYIYLESATCRLIEFRLDELATMTYMGETESMEMTMQMQLIEHLM